MKLHSDKTTQKDVVNVIYDFFVKYIQSISCEGLWVCGYNNEQITWSNIVEVYFFINPKSPHFIFH